MTSNGVFDPKRDDNQFNVLLVEDDHVFRGLIAKISVGVGSMCARQRMD
jgi:hypothetical protein